MTNRPIPWRTQGDVGSARARAAMLKAARGYFDAQNVLEVDAPALCRFAVTDPNIESLAVQPALEPGGRRYLHSSPEFAMKRMLADGFPDIYFIGKVYRDGEAGRRHQPEFTMIEWYRLDFELNAIMDDCETLIAALLESRPLTKPPHRLSYADAFRRYLDVDPLTAKTELLVHRANADAQLRDALGDNRDAWLDLLLATRVANQFPVDRLTSVYHYPASQAALAKLAANDERVAQRFEVFLGELELANGYVELTDAAEQRQRIECDLQRRRDAGKQVYLPDERFLAALEAGLPDCSGVAIGLDRLLMLAMNTADIRDVRHFSWETA